MFSKDKKVNILSNKNAYHIYMDVTKYLADHRMDSCKNHAIEHPGKGMTPT